MDVGRASVELLQTSVSGPTAVCFFCLDTFRSYIYKGVCEIINAVDIFAVLLSVWSV